MPWNSDNENNSNKSHSPWGSDTRRSRGGGNSGGRGGGPNRPDVDLDEMFSRLSENVRRFIPGNNGFLFVLIALLLVGLWLFSGLYRVKQGQEGIVLRFGEYNRVAVPGLNYHLPYPIERAFIVNVIESRTVTIGLQNDRPSSATRAGNDDIERVQKALEKEETITTTSTEENLVLTGDRKMIDISVAVNWNIKETRNYLFNIVDPELVVRDVAESVLREIIGLTDAESLLSTGRSKAALEVKKRMQDTLDRYNSGVLVLAVNILHSTVPEGGVQAMYNDANAAENDAKTYIDQANAHRKLVLPRAEGQAKQIINQAGADKEKLIQSAIGEKAKFEALLGEYQKAPKIVRQRIYLESIGRILQNKNKILLQSSSDQGGSPLQLLSINELLKNSLQPKR